MSGLQETIKCPRSIATTRAREFTILNKRNLDYSFFYSIFNAGFIVLKP